MGAWRSPHKRTNVAADSERVYSEEEKGNALVACQVKPNQHGYLAYQLYWYKLPGGTSWEGTPLKDNPKNRRRMEARVILMNEEFERGTFDYLKWFPNGNKAHLFKHKSTVPETIGEYYGVWIERKKPPVVRAGLERDYRDHFRLYILPKFEDTRLAELTPAMLDALRSYLLHERGLSLKSVRNVIDASFRAMYRDARTVDYVPELEGKDPFGALQWPRLKIGKPDPFTEEERDALIAHFRETGPFYYALVYTLFFTGMRPSEALALRWGDVDLKRREIQITKSRYLDKEAGTKTAASEREIKILPKLAEVLSEIKPLDVTEETHVFLNQNGQPINFHTWRAKIWYRALRAKKIRERKPYTMRHTFISVGLSNGANPKWLGDYCGTSLTMIEKHYGKYIRNDSEEQLSRMLRVKTETLTETLVGTRESGEGEEAEKIQEDVGGPTWTRTRDQPVMSRWL